MSEIERSSGGMTPASELPFQALRERAEAALAAGAVQEPGEPYKPHREMVAEDCDGMMRITDRGEAVWILECDGCGFECGVPVLKMDAGRLREHRLKHAGIPSLFAEREFEAEAAQAPTLDACREWLRRYKAEGGLPAPALWGPAGRGKSHLLSLMVKTLIVRYSVAAMYRPAVVMWEELQQAFGSSREHEVWRRLTSVEVLAIDDLAADRLTEWRADRFLSLLDTRYREERPILIATNVPPGEWSEVFGERQASRLKGMCIPFEMGGPDRRYQGEQLGIGEAA